MWPSKKDTIRFQNKWRSQIAGRAVQIQSVENLRVQLGKELDLSHGFLQGHKATIVDLLKTNLEINSEDGDKNTASMDLLIELSSSILITSLGSLTRVTKTTRVPNLRRRLVLIAPAAGTASNPSQVMEVDIVEAPILRRR